jgi:hypothetical protein
VIANAGGGENLRPQFEPRLHRIKPLRITKNRSLLPKPMLTISIRNRAVRNKIKSVLHKRNHLTKTNERFGLREVDAFCKFATDCGKEARHYSDNSQSVKTDAVYLAVAATGCLGMALTDINSKGPWPKNWVNRFNRPNPNFYLGTMILSLSRSALSVVHLCRLGQDFAARLILRHVIELSWLIIVLSQDQTKLRLHSSARSNKKIQQNWRDNFTAGKLNTALADLEEKLALKKATRNYLYNERRQDYRYYSNSVHNAPIFALVAAYTISKKERMIPAPFGGKSTFSFEGGLDSLLNNLFYFHVLFWKIMQRRLFTLPGNDMWWSSAECLKLCFFSASDLALRRSQGALESRS